MSGMMRNGLEDRYACGFDKCGAVFENSGIAKDHYASDFTRWMKNGRPCRVAGCGVWLSESAATQHFEAVHRGCCLYCVLLRGDATTFANLKTHLVREHSFSRCHACPEVFSRRCALSKHLRKSSCKGPTWECKWEGCSVAHGNRRRAAAHYAEHFNSHLRIHNVCCLIPGCGRLTCVLHGFLEFQKRHPTRCFHCVALGLGTEEFSDLSGHQSEVHFLNICPDCKSATGFLGQELAHVCPEADSPSAMGMKHELRYVEQGHRYECLDRACGKRFSSKRRASLHYATELCKWVRKQPAMQCPYPKCPVVLGVVDAVAHFQRMHPTCCCHCTFLQRKLVDLGTPSRRKEHQVSKHHYAQCEHCNQVFSRLSGLRTHLRTKCSVLPIHTPHILTPKTNTVDFNTKTCGTKTFGTKSGSGNTAAPTVRSAVTADSTVSLHRSDFDLLGFAGLPDHLLSWNSTLPQLTDADLQLVFNS